MLNKPPSHRWDLLVRWYNYLRPRAEPSTCVTKMMMMSGMKMRIVGGRPRAGPGVHVRRILSDPTSEQLRVPELRGREGGDVHFTLEGEASSR